MTLIGAYILGALGIGLFLYALWLDWKSPEPIDDEDEGYIVGKGRPWIR